MAGKHAIRQAVIDDFRSLIEHSSMTLLMVLRCLELPKRDDHTISCTNFYLTVSGKGHTINADMFSPWLPVVILTVFILRRFLIWFMSSKHVWNFHIAKLCRNLETFSILPCDSNLALVLGCDIDHLLQPWTLEANVVTIIR